MLITHDKQQQSTLQYGNICDGHAHTHTRTRTLAKAFIVIQGCRQI